MRPSQPTLNFARRRLVLRDPGACFPAMNSRSGLGMCSATGPGWKPPSSAISRGRDVELVQPPAGRWEQAGLVRRPDLGGQREDQAAGAATGVLAQLGDLHHGSELRRLAQLALADWAGVGVAHRDEAVGDLLASQALGDLLADLRGPLSDPLDPLGRLELRLGAAAPSALAQHRGQAPRLAHRPRRQLARLTSQAQRQLLALPGPPGDRAVQLAQPAADRPGAISHARRPVTSQAGRVRWPRRPASGWRPAPARDRSGSGCLTPRPSSRSAPPEQRTAARHRHRSRAPAPTS